jgi:hypothetical protein
MPKVRRTLIYLHIPKNGGSTFYAEILAKNFSAADLRKPIVTSPEYQEFVVSPDAERNRFKCISGHFPFGIHEHLGSPCTYVSFVREPLARIESLYRFVRSGKVSEEYRNALFKGDFNLPFDEFVKLDFGTENYTLDNLQTQMLTNYSGRGAKHAIDIIRQWFPCVGVLEHFDDSLKVIADRYGLIIPRYEKKNVTPTGFRIPPDELRAAERIMRERNSEDLVLYDFCVRRLRSQLSTLKWPRFVRQLLDWSRAG